MMDKNISKTIEEAIKSRAWPFEEAQKLLKRIDYTLPKKGYVLFEMGYGPSGLPHIGTFGEAVRTTMVRKAFELISGMPTRMFCFSDDMDGMRKVPDTIPNKEEYYKYMDMPLSGIPDPFGTHESYAANMNARLMAFLDAFGFEYEIFSATKCYKEGRFNASMLRVLKNYDAIMNIMLPTLGPERRATYSPFMPICPATGRVLQVPITSIDVDGGTVSYEDGEALVTVPVTDGHCKLQWKPDFGMRWEALQVDFEMYGKDHLVNGPIYSRICEAIGGNPPAQMFYELFLDDKGQKISKTKGNGLSVEEWLRYGTTESLGLLMYQSPQKAKKLSFDVIPKNVD
jgi:lysyl-tRNA synthetase class 1